MFFATAFILTALPVPAQWSVRVDPGKNPKDMYAINDPRRVLPDYLFQPFTSEEWKASNFAPAADVERFEDLRYGMFIHFGLSTYKGKELSWGTVQSIKWPDKRPDGSWAPPGPIHDEYLHWPEQMRLEKFDARQWVQIARDCGFRYIVAIAKHHEGFHMWDTVYSDFKITNTPFRRDYLKELADACHNADMPFGIYYAQREWHHPDYDPGNPKGERHQRYMEYNRNVCRELCTKYGKLEVFWFDALWWGGMFTADMWDAESLTRMMRKLQPHMLINNRTSLPGDFDTPEQRSGYYQERPWEACFSLADSWSWTGSPPKSRHQLVRILASTACANGNALVSWGPRWNGAFDEHEVNRLREVGDWLEKYGTSIYGTRGGPWLPANWGGSTHTGKTVYLHLLDPDIARLELPPIPARVDSASMLGDRARVPFEQNSLGLQLVIPLGEHDPADTVVVLQLDQAVTGTVRSGQTIGSFDDPLAYGSVLLARTNVPIANGLAILDIEKIRKVTGVSVEQSGGSPTLTLSLSEDGHMWTQIAAITKPPSVWQVPVENPATGSLLPGRNARYLKIETSQPVSFPEFQSVQVHGF